MYCALHKDRSSPATQSKLKCHFVMEASRVVLEVKEATLCPISLLPPHPMSPSMVVFAHLGICCFAVCFPSSPRRQGLALSQLTQYSQDLTKALGEGRGSGCMMHE